LIEILETRIAPAVSISIFTGAAGSGDLDGALADGVVTEVEVSLAVQGTLSSGALEAIAAGTDISVTSPFSITFNLSSPLALQTAPGAKVTLSAPHGQFLFLDSSDSLSTAGGQLELGGANVVLFGSVSSSGGAITVTGDAIGISNGINAGTGTVTLRPLTPGQQIDLGHDDSGPTLGLTPTELNFITAGVIRIGSANSGNVFVTGAINLAGAPQFEVFTGGSIMTTGSGKITTSRLGLSAGFGIGDAVTPLSVDVANVEAETTGGGVFLYSSGGSNLTIGGVNASLSGIRTGSGNISVFGTRDLTVAEAISSTGGGSITVNNNNPSAAVILSVNAPITSTGGNGNIMVQAEDDLVVTAQISTTGTGMILLQGDYPTNGTTDGNISILGPVMADAGLVYIVGVEAAIGSAVTTAGGNVEIHTSSLALTAPVDAGSGRVLVDTIFSFQGIDLGGSADGGGRLAVSDTELDFITAAVVQIGNGATADIAIVGPITAPAGVGALSLQAGGITQGAPLMVQQVAIVTGGNVVLTDPGNDIGALAASVTGIGVKTFSYVDANGFTLDAVDGIAGGVSMLSAAPDSIVLLSGGGAVTQAAGSALIAPKLQLFGTGSFTLQSGLNNVGILSAFSSGAFRYTNAGALTISHIGSNFAETDGITTSNGDITLATIDGDLTIENTSASNDLYAGQSGVLSLTAGSAAGFDRALILVPGARISGVSGFELVADHMDFGTGASVNSPAFIGALRPFSAGTLIDLGGADGLNKLGLTSAEIDAIDAAELHLGSMVSGSISLSAAISPVYASRLEVTTGGAITSAGGSLEEAKLLLRAGTGIGSNATPLIVNFVSAEAATTTGGIFIFHTGSSTPTIGGVSDAFTGLSAGGGHIGFTSNASLTIDEAITNTGGGDISLNAQSGALIINAPVTATGGNGAISVVAERELQVLAALSTVGTGGITAISDSDGDADGPFESNAAGTVTTAGGAITIKTGPLGAAENEIRIGGVLSSPGGNAAVSITTGGSIVLNRAITVGSGLVILQADAGYSGVGDFFSAASAPITTTGQVIIRGANATIEAAITASSLLVDTVYSGADGSILVNASLTSTGVVGTITLTSDDALTINAVLRTSGAQIAVLAADMNGDSGGSLTFGPNAVTAIDLTSLTSGSGYDVLSVIGTVTLGGTLELAPTFTPANEDSFVILTNNGSDPIQGTFAGLQEGSVITVGSSYFVLSYVGGDGNDVELTTLIPTFTLGAKGKTVSFTDPDGDTVTVKTSLGSFTGDELVLVPGFGGNGAVLSQLNLGSAFKGANITITAKRGPLGGNGFANIGHLAAIGTDLGAVTIAGDLGQIDAGAVKSLTVQSLGALGVSTQGVGGDLRSDITGKLGALTVKSSIHGASIFGSSSIGAVKIGGSFLGGQLSAGADLGAVTVRGDIVGTAAAPVVISAFGKAIAPAKGSDLAIKSLNVAGGVEYLRVLAGYDLALNGANADASVGAVTVGADWRASTLLAGVAVGGDSFAGTGDETKLGGGGIRDNSAIIATVASLTIKGQAFGTADTFTDAFGIVAEQINKAKVGGVSFKFVKGPDTASTAPDVFALAANGPGATGLLSDFFLREITVF